MATIATGMPQSHCVCGASRAHSPGINQRVIHGKFATSCRINRRAADEALQRNPADLGSGGSSTDVFHVRHLVLLGLTDLTGDLRRWTA